MYAVVKSGGSHYRVEVGDVIDVEKLPVEAGEEVELDEVILISGEDGLTVGQPHVEGAKVLATVRRQALGPKITVFKMRPKKRYRRKQGHRQKYT
ncbi:MAG: 50S ribosomal protein L21, partial [Chloroflexota bacterium]